MSKPSRIALALSSSALCLGVALAPTSFAASSTATTAKHVAATPTSHAKAPQHKKAHQASTKKPMTAPAAKMPKH